MQFANHCEFASTRVDSRFKRRIHGSRGSAKAVGSDLIDWKYVSLQALWLLGLSVVVASFSYHHWLARTTNRRLRDQLKASSWGIASSFGLMLFCLSFTIKSEGVLESMLWALLFLGYLWRMIFLAASARKR